MNKSNSPSRKQNASQPVTTNPSRRKEGSKSVEIIMRADPAKLMVMTLILNGLGEGGLVIVAKVNHRQ